MPDTQFTETQKAAVVSLLIEMMNVDGDVDPRERDEFNLICAEYAISDDVYRIGRALNCIIALDIMKRMSDVQKIVVARLLTRMIDADAKDDDNEINLFNIICDQTGVSAIISAMETGDAQGGQ